MRTSSTLPRDSSAPRTSPRVYPGQPLSNCPNDYLPISGGLFTSAPEPQLLTSTPRLAENDWEIEIDGANDGGQITVTVVCLAASDDTTDADSQDSTNNRRTRKRSRKR